MAQKTIHCPPVHALSGEGGWVMGGRVDLAVMGRSVCLCRTRAELISTLETCTHTRPAAHGAHLGRHGAQPAAPPAALCGGCAAIARPLPAGEGGVGRAGPATTRRQNTCHPRGPSPRSHSVRECRRRARAGQRRSGGCSGSGGGGGAAGSNYDSSMPQGNTCAMRLSKWRQRRGTAFGPGGVLCRVDLQLLDNRAEPTRCDPGGVRACNDDDATTNNNNNTPGAR